MPAESPALGLSPLQFEALITTARLSHNLNDFALIALLGLLGLRIFEACTADIGDLGIRTHQPLLRRILANDFHRIPFAQCPAIVEREPVAERSADWIDIQWAPIFPT